MRFGFFGFFLALFAAAPGVRAAVELELSRTVPVGADQPIPVQDFFRPPVFSGPKFNAAGDQFVAAIDQGDRAALLTCDLRTMKLDFLQGAANKDLYSYRWLDGEKVLTTWVTDKLYAEGLYVVDVHNLDGSYAVESHSATAVLGVPRAAPLKPVVWIMRNAYDDGKDGGVVQLDTSKRLGRNRDALPGSMHERMANDERDLYGFRASVARSYSAPTTAGVVIDYLCDKDGELAFALTADHGVLALQRYADKKWLSCPVDLDRIDIVGPGNRPGELVVVGPRRDGAPRPLQLLDATTGQLGEVLYQDKAYDATDCTLYRQPGTGLVLGVRLVRSRAVSVWFDAAYATVQQMLEQKFPAQVVQILGSDEKESRFFFCTFSDRQPTIYYSLDVEARTVGLIKNSRPWLEAARLQPMNVMRFKTRDGRQLDAYVTLPAGAAKERPAPLVVLPHGGPWVRDEWGFDGEAQFLASRGYAVLQPNYRGSTGAAWLFPAADQWAFRKMHDDVTDAVTALVRTGLVDDSRLAIMGTSFGGYLAACGAAFEPGRYRCAIAIAGVFDWAQVMRTAKQDQYESSEYGMLRRNLGDPKKEAELFAAISPLRHVDQMRIPVFVAHGKEDSIADIDESRSLIAQLKKFEVPHETMIVSGEGHGMSFLKNRVELYSRVEAFLAKHLAPMK